MLLGLGFIVILAVEWRYRFRMARVGATTLPTIRSLQCVFVASILLASCDKPAPPAGGQSGSAKSSLVGRWRIDSAAAIRIADSALHERVYPSPLIVASFKRDSAGYMIQLVPKPPANPREGNGGGGGEVVIDSSGAVRILRRYE
jgi:hypothetical protein